MYFRMLWKEFATLAQIEAIALADRKSALI